VTKIAKNRITYITFNKHHRFTDPKQDATLPLTTTFASLLISFSHSWPLNLLEESQSLAHSRKQQEGLQDPVQLLHQEPYRLAARKLVFRSVFTIFLLFIFLIQSAVLLYFA